MDVSLSPHSLIASAIPDSCSALSQSFKSLRTELAFGEGSNHRGSKGPPVLTHFDGHLKTGDTCPDGVRLNGQALEAQVHQRIQV